MAFFKIQNQSNILFVMNDRDLFSRKQSNKAQTRLKRLRTILPLKGSHFLQRF
jgi:hypothetical protein